MPIFSKVVGLTQNWIGLYGVCVPIDQIEGFIRLNPLAQSEWKGNK